MGLFYYIMCFSCFDWIMNEIIIDIMSFQEIDFYIWNFEIGFGFMLSFCIMVKGQLGIWYVLVFGLIKLLLLVVQDGVFEEDEVLVRYVFVMFDYVIVRVMIIISGVGQLYIIELRSLQDENDGFRKQNL